MASTSTNKQPLLVDRVMHNVINLDKDYIGTIDIQGANTAKLLVDGSQSDGCIIEDIYSIARGTVEYTINLYISPEFDYLRPGRGIFVGSFKSANIVGKVTRWEEMPKILAPVPQTGSEAQFRAFYLPKGRVLWAAREDTEEVTNGPLVGAQGGWY